MEDIKKDKKDDDFDSEISPEPEEKVGCCSKCKKSKKKSKKTMKKEETDFEASLRRQTGGIKFFQNEDGYWMTVKEDVLITPQQPEKTEEPAPGEPGFAPQQKIGLTGSSFQEWANKYKK
jgi:hypothetical protein